ncbi:hypothetical protein JMN32_14255 [Fulvivirga sp. 29W222]|uniref:Uncharacterized protein n=1 Tax=Fulvivirga marina TaxID=2494733 RepID=A0A937FZ29_9BACT|nr:hypothetical protein [Fulvivirga marina]MBL6447477.1 hypothetical protein [Fulvivirga marina]
MKILGLRIYNSSYWARMGVVVFEGFLILPIYIIASKYILGCDAFISEDNNLKIGFAIFGLTLLGFNYYYYSVDRINKLRHRFKERRVWGVIKLLLMFIFFFFWVLKAGNIIRLFFDIPQC